MRFEVQTALEHGVRVIPVLVDGARPPRQQQLPAALHKLARLNALELSYSRFQYDADRLLELIQRVLAAAPGTVTVHQPPGATAEVLAASDDVQHDRSIPGKAAQEDPPVIRNDPDRAARLLAEVERLAQSMTGESWRHSALVGVAEALVATDADRAVRLAGSMTDGPEKADALAEIAKTLAASFRTARYASPSPSPASPGE